MSANELDVDEFLCFALYSASQSMSRFYSPVLAGLGLTYPQYLVMVTLWECDGQTVGDLAKKLLLVSSTLTPILQRLETAGLIERVRGGRGRKAGVRATD